LTKIAVLLVVVFLSVGAPALALAADKPAEAAAPAVAPAQGITVLAGAAFWAGLVMIGAGYGIGRIGGSAVESMARQPEVATNIFTAMILVAALVEGVTFFALIICFM